MVKVGLCRLRVRKGDAHKERRPFVHTGYWRDMGRLPWSRPAPFMGYQAVFTAFFIIASLQGKVNRFPKRKLRETVRSATKNLTAVSLFGKNRLLVWANDGREKTCKRQSRKNLVFRHSVTEFHQKEH